MYDDIFTSWKHHSMSPTQVYYKTMPKAEHKSDFQFTKDIPVPHHQGPLLQTWTNFNPSMDK